MTPQQQAIIEQIKIHSDIIAELLKQLSMPVRVKKKGCTPEEMARFEAKFRKSMYK